MDTSPPCVSFIGIVDFSQEARWLFMTDSVTDLLGFEPHELIGRPSLELAHPDEFTRVRQIHYDTINQDKAAVLAYLRLRHKDPYKGYILCGISRTVVHNVLVGSVSFASPGAKALHNASTAQEITVITPSAKNFEFRRWGDPSPMPPSPVQRSLTLSPASSSSSWTSPDSSGREGSPERNRSLTPEKEKTITFDPLPTQSIRTALILNRFSVNCTVNYCSNDLLLSTTDAIGRSFFDFVARQDEDVVRSWIDVIKSWGVNERGQPSDGGFGFGRFSLLPEGRDSITRVPDPPPSRHRRGSTSHTKGRSSKPAAGPPSRPRLQSRATTSSSLEAPQVAVDAIFSAHSDGLMVILRQAS